MSAPRVDDDAKRRNRAQALVFILFPIVLNLGLKAQREKLVEHKKENDYEPDRLQTSTILIFFNNLMVGPLVDGVLMH